MTTGEIIEIPSSKKKLIKTLIGGIFLFAGSIWMLVSDHVSTNFLLRLPYVKNSIAIAGIVFFGGAFFVMVKKISSKKPGLIISDEGITYGVATANPWLVPWSDIEEVVSTVVMRQEFLTLIVRNPEEYIARQSNFLLRKTMQLNFKSYGSPIQIPINHLKVSPAEVKSMIATKMIGRQSV
ncbi:STM3941 family protein [Chitinophaga sp. CF418]|uniref:STM3941 family protein n=1 Tax=Chitinophaga sp. CF418 TaxID=1855287 RepID=UPI000911ADDD|nr:STM3941 family protein [Chitinophaga sp. CF418]SHN40441.1 hypothetical protein SAMN05216311_11217 [Chitinophaga sp. CF418]